MHWFLNQEGLDSSVSMDIDTGVQVYTATEKYIIIMKTSMTNTWLTLAQYVFERKRIFYPHYWNERLELNGRNIFRKSSFYQIPICLFSQQTIKISGNIAADELIIDCLERTF